VIDKGWVSFQRNVIWFSFLEVSDQINLNSCRIPLALEIIILQSDRSAKLKATGILFN
jgi:hypothetical protein